MPKKYFCENIIDLEVCGEEDPENFSPGRYNRCRKCRNLDSKKHQQRLKDQTIRENIEERTEEIKDGKKIQLLVESIIIGKGLIDEGLTIPEAFFYTQSKFKSSIDMTLGLIKTLQEDNQKLKNENVYLKQDLEKIKKDQSKIKTFLEEKFDLKFFD